ncbi:hypothetical protein [Bifidobacterium felsineum]|uniref:hypothetical protein n=1 Tax=Bifidobacterium felsineum TaxID=2045440 RepID=UPI001BDD4BB0|nr:hypothetical protein [Bifidobacterium felsineum]MBT1164625.1 hypothetical protein [Bifidobacterium felsineum]
MTNELDKALKVSMLRYVLENRYDWDDDELDDPPVEVTGWEEFPFMDATCDTCGPEWPHVNITYRTRSGATYVYMVEDDFGDFMRRLTGQEEME